MMYMFTRLYFCLWIRLCHFWEMKLIMEFSLAETQSRTESNKRSKFTLNVGNKHNYRRERSKEYATGMRCSKKYVSNRWQNIKLNTSFNDETEVTFIYILEISLIMSLKCKELINLFSYKIFLITVFYLMISFTFALSYFLMFSTLNFWTFA